MDKIFGQETSAPPERNSSRTLMHGLKGNTVQWFNLLMWNRSGKWDRVLAPVKGRHPLPGLIIQWHNSPVSAISRDKQKHLSGDVSRQEQDVCGEYRLLMIHRRRWSRCCDGRSSLSLITREKGRDSSSRFRVFLSSFESPVANNHSLAVTGVKAPSTFRWSWCEQRREVFAQAMTKFTAFFVKSTHHTNHIPHSDDRLLTSEVNEIVRSGKVNAHPFSLIRITSR